MSRSDQYVGLTTKGNEFIRNFPKKDIINKKEVFMCHQAFNPWPLTGIEITTKDRIYREVLQCDPWSSGPVYLTHIAVFNKQKKLLGYMFSWIEDENVTGEVDPDNGKYYI